MNLLGRWDLWPLRAVWILVAATTAASGADALEGRSQAVAATLAVICWAAWTAALIAMLVPSTLSLTVVRVIVPAGLAVAFAAAGADGGAVALASVLTAGCAVAFALTPTATNAFVDGSSYGPERRVALRTPVLTGVLAVAVWLVVMAGSITGPLLLAAQQWLAGAAATVVGVGAVFVGARSLHLLSKRWIVLVPTGMVLHDPLTMPEPQLFLRQTMDHLGPALVDDHDLDTEDLTAGASGLALELVLDEAVELLVNRGRRDSESRAVRRVLFTPSSSSAALAAARTNRLPVR